MQPSMPFDWGRVITPLRWAARIVAVGYGEFWAAVMLVVLVGEGSGPTSFPAWVPFMLYGILSVGLVIAIFWTGIGEVVGGLTAVAAAAAVAAMAASVLTQGAGAILFHLPFVLTGLAFIACGWYTLEHQHPHTTPRAA